MTATLYKTTGSWRGPFRLAQVGPYNFFGPMHSFLSVVSRVGLNHESAGELALIELSQTLSPRKHLTFALPRMSAAFSNWPAIRSKEVHV
jgi:hypothetical protein